ncbi:MAG TPA: RNA polymerase sporulation sigma factor SigK [Firmicutes bacterium]|nr:RNA polymerase sporulation sigma factor SigK [Bacillota bacterium]
MASVLLAGLAFVCRGIHLFISYVTSSSIFPAPLTEEEEKELLSRREAGDEDARNILVERNLRLVAHIVKKFDGKAEELDDLISIGTIGLIKAIDTFNQKKKTRLATYAARCIENEILMHLRAQRKNRGEVLLYDPIGADKEGNEITLIDVLSSEDGDIAENVEALVEEAKRQEKVACLNQRERRVIEMRYGLYNGVRRTQREVSKRLGISRSYVSRIEKRAIAKLQKHLLADGYN